MCVIFIVFFVLSSDLPLHFSRVICVVFPPGPGTPKFDGVTLTGCFFPYLQITSGNLMFMFYFSSFVLLSSGLRPHFSLVNWVFYWPGRLGPPLGSICRSRAGNGCLCVIFHPSFYFPEGPPPFLARDLGFLGSGRLGLLRGRSADIERMKLMLM